MTAEYGSIGKIRFVKAKMYDADGKETLCKCGNPAVGGILGIDAYMVYCHECDPCKRK